MPTTILFNSLAAISTAIVGAAGVAIASFSGTAGSPYENSVERLTRAEVAQHAWSEFERADINGDNRLSADEFAALTIVKAELAHLNGFVAIEGADGVRRIDLPIASPGSLPSGEHTRIDAVARHTFYSFAGTDGAMDADDFISMNEALFSAADHNRNNSLAKSELVFFGGQQAQLRAGV